MSRKIEARLKSLGIELATAPSPVGNYVPHLVAGDILYISGQLAKNHDGGIMTGRLGVNLTVDDGKAAARICALNILSQAQSALGTLDRVVQVIRLNGFICASPEFIDHPLVINGASDLMVDVFAERGRHTRAAVGVVSLPANSAVEIDAVFQIASG